jgi:hypothetical protein
MDAAAQQLLQQVVIAQFKVETRERIFLSVARFNRDL